ncbi:cupin domain-containing protein [Sphingomonas sp. DT-51]|uniref:cupin domain-containing protein n=1 Tax=Sphingomonas sp. DT-51 TaxID=3396165 RepID=UPI003F1BEF54
MIHDRARRARTAALALAALTLTAQAPRPAPPAPVEMWVPKKTPYAAYDAPNRPWWKLADVLALHKGATDWSQPIVRNRDIVADWHQQAPGKRTTEVAYSDNRTAIIVWGGQLRVAIAGQPPFVAGKGFEIDVPLRVPFTLETVGDQPALWFEIHAATDMPLYPVTSTTERPRDAAGFRYDRRLVSGGSGAPDAENPLYLDYYKDVVQANTRPGAFIAAQHLFVNNIRGRATPTPPASNLGHFHVGYDEFWFVMEGNIDLQIEGEPLIKAAAPGDVLIAKQGRWHRASFGGPEGQMGTRVAVNPYPQGLHGYSVESRGRQ